ncbi:MAG: phosphotransferase [Chloroflexi bacterium]|nr:phosphotransferase [Chloroflexota bacterium]
MEQIIRDRYSPGILEEARRRYGVAPDDITLLDGFESFIYAFRHHGADYILRLGHNHRRSPDLVRAEVDWINYLAARGAGVAQATLSENGELVELIADGAGGHFLATAFVKAAGGPVWQMGGWTEAFNLAYGRLLGRIHALSKMYRPSNPAWRRPQWDDPINNDVYAALSQEESAVAERYRAVFDHLLALPRTPDGYGMIHQDAHTGNLFVDENGRITLFDFDDCVYGHFAYDLAMVLFYAIVNREDAATFAQMFWPQFWRGYCEENALDGRWLEEIPFFMKLREIDLYAVLLRDVGLEGIEAHPWTAQFMRGRRERIENDIPCLAVDWPAFSRWAGG